MSARTYICQTCQRPFRPASGRPQRCCSVPCSRCPDLDHFLFHVQPATTPAGCWIWKGPVTPEGRPLCIPRRSFNGGVLAVKAAWLLHGRAIPPGMYVAPACGNPKCVRVEHLALFHEGEARVSA